MNMNLKILKNDFKRNRAGNMSLLLLMTLAACLVVVATMVATQLITSMMGMYKTALPPHFLQMHKGEINQESIDKFNSSYDGVTYWQTAAMIDVYGDDLKVYGDDVFSLSDCRLDISLVKQNMEYDVLLDEDRNAINVNKGEIGIPVILLDYYDINIGDKVVLTSNGITREFKVTAFVHDAQMNSTLCSSTRMLINDEDFEELFGNVGENEYLIETYFTDSSKAKDYQTSYENAGLPQNGQAVTYAVIFLLSAFRDIAMAMVIILISVLLVMNGEDISKLDDEKMSSIRLNKMGFIFQQSHLLKTLSIRDNIVLPGFKAGCESRENVNKYAKELMKRTDIEGIADHDIKKVSGGQLQRAAICRALINHPDIIFGDEPTGSLNSGATKEIMNIINEVNAEGTTVMLVTHDAKVASRADRVIFLADGNITDEIFLGKYEEKNFLSRENKMTEWLGKQGF